MYIPSGPTSVSYSVNVPNQDCDNDPEHRLERTAVSHIFAFIQQAIGDEAPDQAWMASARTKLKRWEVEYLDILSHIPETERKSMDASAYRPGRCAPNNRTSPVMLRKRCADNTRGPRAMEESDSEDGGGNEAANSPSRYIQTTSTSLTAESGTESSQRKKSSRRHGQGNSDNMTSLRLGPLIESRPYCTQKCLLGMRDGLRLDPPCPNV